MAVSFETVYRDFDSSLRKFIRRRIDDKDTSEDILQEVYIKIHGNIGNLRDTKRLSFWIYQITRNAIIDQYRRGRPGTQLTEDLTAPQIEEPDLYAELASSVRGILDCLPADDRQALLLADLQGMKQSEVARHLGLSLSGAKSRIQRARQKLKQAFLDCCHFEFDHSGRLMDFQSNCDRCANRQTQSTCKDEPCEDTHLPSGQMVAN